MEHDKARALLDSDRARTQQRLNDAIAEGGEDRTAANEPGDMFDSAEPLVAEGIDDSVVADLREHLAAIDRAERRLDAGTFGLSVRSGVPIAEDRLEADPTAELTVDEAVSDSADPRLR
jgi:DnaK suppressor protein